MQEKSTLKSIIATAQEVGAKSAFLYGSRARREATSKSDYDTGLIFDDEAYVSNKNLKNRIRASDNISYNPHKLSEITTCTMKGILPRAIFFHDLKATAKTIYGPKLIETISPPPITVLDLIQTIRFYMGMSFCSSMSYRRGEAQTASDEASKSCLHGLKALQIFQLRKFPSSYKQIYKYRKQVTDNPHFLSLIEAAYSYRAGDSPIEEKYVSINLAFLDHIERQLITLSSTPHAIIIK